MHIQISLEICRQNYIIYISTVYIYICTYIHTLYIVLGNKERCPSQQLSGERFRSLVSGSFDYHSAFLDLNNWFIDALAAFDGRKALLVGRSNRGHDQRAGRGGRRCG